MSEPILFRKVPNIEALHSCAQQHADVDPGFIEAFLILVYTSSELLNAGVEYFQEYGTSPARFGLMMQLNMNKEHTLSPSDLAELTGVTRATITGLLDGLERDGFIQRQPDPNDRRSQTVHLTEKAQTFLDGFLPGHFKRIQGLMSNVSVKEKKQLVSTLTKILDNLTVLGHKKP
ncbi:MAG: MarR family transcriptional regulator [Candidatus Hinthialibacter antarcticus]|nr:MarR family transcriptional regulator [Candidatus Hinthialibacter antarcticus]